ncbi:MAG: hypothetical protein Q8K92_19835 [Leadbetterella sp.]|nr:hypothetical protein [Leadbetterella sp.]
MDKLTEILEHMSMQEISELNREVYWILVNKKRDSGKYAFFSEVYRMVQKQTLEKSRGIKQQFNADN